MYLISYQKERAVDVLLRYGHVDVVDEILLAPVVQTLNSAIHRINHHQIELIGIRRTNCAIHRIEIYPVDSIIHLLNNFGQFLNQTITIFILKESER